MGTLHVVILHVTGSIACASLIVIRAGRDPRTCYNEATARHITA